MTGGQYRIFKARLPLLGGLAGHNLLIDPASTLARRLLQVVLLLVTAVASIAAPAQAASAAQNAPSPLSVVWSFTHEGIVRFCYDQNPAVIYFEYDLARKVTSIKKKELDGDERVIAEFPGTRDERSLSCSQDGQTIAATGNTDRKSIFLMRGTSTALYTVPVWTLSNVGLYSLLAPDGKSIRLREGFTLVSGTDLLRDMKVFPDSEHGVFFVEDYVYVTGGEHSVYKNQYIDGEWKPQQQIKLLPQFSLSEVARCGNHDVASLVGYDSSSAMVLDDGLAAKPDWLARIGARKLFRKCDVPMTITGSNGACAFPLLRRPSRGPTAVGLARFDANGLQIFSLPYPEARLVDDDVYFSKDGCYVLIQIAGPEVQLLHVQSQRCQ